MENLVPLFIIATAVAVVIQAGILVALFVSIRKTSVQVEALTAEVKTKALPTIETAQAMLVELRPRISEIVANVEHSSRIARAQIERVDATVSDAVDRTRLQVIRADELINRTLDRVVSPLRQVQGLFQGLTAGLEFFLGRKRRQGRDGMGVPQDELFI